MIVKKQEMSITIGEKMRNGNGSVHMQQLIPSELFYGHGRLYSLVTLEPGCSIGWHEHVGESESYYLLSGTAKVNDNGTDVVLRAGDSAICPDGEGHAIENCGDQPLSFLALILFGAGLNH